MRTVGTCLGGFVFGLLLLAACSNGGGAELNVERADVPTSVAGVWRWKTLEDLPCNVPPGLLDRNDGDEIFTVTQTGNELSADFIDDGGNHVTMTGTIDGEFVTGAFCIEVPAMTASPVVGGPCPGAIGWLNAPDGAGLDAYDLGTGQLIRQTTIPGGIAATDRPSATPDGNFVFVGRSGSASLFRIDTRPSGTLTDLSNDINFIQPAAHCATNDRLFVSDIVSLDGADNVLRVISLTTSTEIDTIPVSGRAFDAVTTNGAFVYLLDVGNARILEVDIANRTERQFNLLNIGPNSFDITPNGQSLVVVSPFGLEIVDTALSPGASQTYPFAGFDVKISSDGARAYFTALPSIGGLVQTGIDPTYARCFDLGSRTVVASFESDLGSVGGFGIDLCPGNDHALATLSGLTSSFFLPFLDLTSGTVSDTTIDGTGLGFVIITQSDQVPPGNTAPRKIIMSFTGLAAFSSLDRMVDGSFLITQDNVEPACVGQELGFWSFVGSDD